MRCEVTPTEIPAVKQISCPRFSDPRGYLAEVFRKRDFARARLDFEPVQENISFSKTVGTVRGLHFQQAPHEQAKLVRVFRGAVLDVAVDLRTDSPTYGNWIGRELSSETGVQLFVPRGFAHGFCTLMPDTLVVYLLDEYYHPQSEGGIHWRSPELGIEWPGFEAYTVSERDQALDPFRREITL